MFENWKLGFPIGSRMPNTAINEHSKSALQWNQMSRDQHIFLISKATRVGIRRHILFT